MFYFIKKISDHKKISYKQKLKIKIAVKTYNPLLWLKGIYENNDIIENAQRIHIPDKTVRIKYVNIYLKKGFDTDSSFVRVNFYKTLKMHLEKELFSKTFYRRNKLNTAGFKLM